ncbi:LysR family transcriptional regulator [Phyllobacterium myrsinacearum]|uniref:LysR family carnitine catabolism transcriptional activator n=1 Tax=Phyllobacterium myrsinacearum TaxID=28101 RepID=A0A839EDH2_9HYPH|nr:LysR family transcriptional regulator [Phyllobacterium myrsinacearum]MBA8876478.1 LysR family carnitine catabolism transcriptional activator [Phyllobacterium myrsinacearum]
MKRIDLSPFELQIFLKVQESGSFRAAADTFGLSQPAISRAISRIEERVGTRLLDRDSRNVQLTPQGRVFVPLATRLINDLETSLDELGAFLGAERGKIAVAALPSVAVSILPAALALFRKTNPGIVVRVVDTLLEEVTSIVGRGEVDFGIAVAPTSDNEMIAFNELLREPLVGVFSRNSAAGPPVHSNWATLAEYPFIAMSSTTSVRRLTDAAFLQADQIVSPAYEVSHLATAGALVAAGLGVTALPQLALSTMDQSALATCTLDQPVASRSIGFLTRAGRTLSPGAVAFMQVIRTSAIAS